MTTSCERYEIDIGRRQHGALDPGEAAALDAHLGGCPACRTFADELRGVEAALAERARADLEAVDWDLVDARIRRLARGYRLKLWVAPLFLLQLPVSFVLATGRLPSAELLAVVPPLTVAIYLGFVWLVNRPLRVLVAAGARGDDLLAGYRGELRRQRLRAWIFVAANAAFAATSVAAGALAGGRLVAYGLGCAALFAAWAGYDLAVRLPRLGKALAELAR